MRIEIKYALFIFLGLVGYFTVMRLLNLHHIVELRIFNFVIVSMGVYAVIKKNMKQGNVDYLRNLFLGFITAGIAIIAFTIGVYLYLNFIDPSFINTLMGNEWWYTGPNPSYVALAIFSEGISSGFIISFIAMQYLKGKSFSKSTSSG